MADGMPARATGIVNVPRQGPTEIVITVQPSKWVKS